MLEARLSEIQNPEIPQPNPAFANIVMLRNRLHNSPEWESLKVVKSGINLPMRYFNTAHIIAARGLGETWDPRPVWVDTENSTWEQILKANALFKLIRSGRKVTDAMPTASADVVEELNNILAFVGIETDTLHKQDYSRVMKAAGILSANEDVQNDPIAVKRINDLAEYYAALPIEVQSRGHLNLITKFNLKTADGRFNWGLPYSFDEITFNNGEVEVRDLGANDLPGGYMNSRGEIITFLASVLEIANREPRMLKKEQGCWVATIQLTLNNINKLSSVRTKLYADAGAGKPLKPISTNREIAQIAEACAVLFNVYKPQIRKFLKTGQLNTIEGAVDDHGPLAAHEILPNGPLPKNQKREPQFYDKYPLGSVKIIADHEPAVKTQICADCSSEMFTVNTHWGPMPRCPNCGG